MGHTLDPSLVPEGDRWCDCADAPLGAPTRAAGLLEHTPECGFPARLCSVRAHRVTVHEGCGRELPYRFCQCQPSGYTFDAARGWWVHYYCGWPTLAWFSRRGSLPPEHLLGVRPVTLHEFVPVARSKSPKSAFMLMTDQQREWNARFADRWVRD